MEQSTLDYLYQHLLTNLNDYTSLEALKKDILDYSIFMKDVYLQPTYFCEFIDVKRRYIEFLDQNSYQDNDFTLFQKHLIYRCLLEGYRNEEISEFVTAKISDDEMEQRYYDYIGK